MFTLTMWPVNTGIFFFQCPSFSNTHSHWEELLPSLLPGEIKTTSGKKYSINLSPQYFFTPFIISKAAWVSDIWSIFIILLSIQTLNHPNKVTILQACRKDTQVLFLLHSDSSFRFSWWMFENSNLRLLLSLLPMLYTGFSDAQHWNLPPADWHVVFRSKMLEGQLPQICHSTPSCHQFFQMEIYHNILSQLRGRNKICTLIPFRCVFSL